MKILNPFFLILFQLCVWKCPDGLPLFLLFSRKIAGKIKVKVQTNGMAAIHQGDSTVMIHPPKIPGFIQYLGLAKSRVTQLKPEKIIIDELSCQPGCLLDVLSKAITEEINTTLKKCMTCYDTAVQVHF